ncbi:flavin reductase family protein [Amycolatopsis antarctica]|uniref:flavin reductase family protein n=1 Tax=Amycolatopsis antarctica TaxID=1854586 RepID=UPI001F0A7E67|nr:flavin reductase family protein [Amycolatopsis antarctica]
MPAALRDFMSAFCTGVTVITSIDGEGRPHGLTCTSLASVTLSPPTLLVCLNTGSGTLAALRQSGGFAVNLLHERGRRAAETFASRAADRFDRVRWCRSGTVGQPWLTDDAFALAECEVADTVAVGDHVVVFGRVVGVEHVPEVPLLYGMRTFSSWFAALPDEAPTA